MSHGTPDWGLTAGVVTTYQLTDLAELAVRLGSIVSFDRRGDGMWLDGFEDGLGKWKVGSAGTGGAVEQSVMYARNGKTSVKLIAGSDGFRSAAIDHYHPLPVLGLLGVEFSFYRASAIDNIQLTLIVCDGTTGLSALIRWSDDGDKLQYWNSSFNWVDIVTGLDLPTTETLFHTVKLVVDVVAHEYVRVIVDGVTYSLAGVAVQAEASSVSPFESVNVTLYGRAGQNDTVYADDVILTQNEPA